MLPVKTHKYRMSSAFQKVGSKSCKPPSVPFIITSMTPDLNEQLASVYGQETAKTMAAGILEPGDRRFGIFQSEINSLPELEHWLKTCNFGHIYR